jgi:3-methyladenine DNA glycosylase Tag
MRAEDRGQRTEDDRTGVLLQDAGIIRNKAKMNDHLIHCYRYKELKNG